jgi:hypothetical protein
LPGKARLAGRMQTGWSVADRLPRSPAKAFFTCQGFFTDPEGRLDGGRVSRCRQGCSLGRLGIAANTSKPGISKPEFAALYYRGAL